MNTDEKYNPHSIKKISNNISINCISSEARDLLDKIMQEWEEWHNRLKRLSNYQKPGYYGFAYWLVRWSNLIKPNKNKNYD